MEMKENLYPRLPTAPPTEDQGVSITKNKQSSNVFRKGSSN